MFQTIKNYRTDKVRIHDANFDVLKLLSKVLPNRGLQFQELDRIQTEINRYVKQQVLKFWKSLKIASFLKHIH